MQTPVSFRGDDRAKLAGFVEIRHFGALVVASESRPAPEDYVAKMLNAIMGVRLTIKVVETVEGVRKHSQSRNERDRTSVFNGFVHTISPSARQLADEMSRTQTPTKA